MGNELAILGGSPARTKAWPTWPVWDEREVQALTAAVNEPKWAIDSPIVARFEKDFASYHDAEFGIAVTSGTTGLMAALRGVGLCAGGGGRAPARERDDVHVRALAAKPVQQTARTDDLVVGVSAHGQHAARARNACRRAVLSHRSAPLSSDAAGPGRDAATARRAAERAASPRERAPA